MTLKELITGALQQLDRNTDSQTMELWRDKLTQYFNDAMVDISHVLQPFRTDAAQLTNARLDTHILPRECVKVLSIRRGGKRYGFFYGGEIGVVHVPGLSDGEIAVTYRCLPQKLAADTDVPELPEWSHGSLISYVVGRERAMGDNMSVNNARACFEVYNRSLQSIGKPMGETDAYKLINCY